MDDEDSANERSSLMKLFSLFMFSHTKIKLKSEATLHKKTCTHLLIALMIIIMIVTVTVIIIIIIILTIMIIIIDR